MLLVVGVAGALWSASGWVGGVFRASNTIYETDEGRPFWKLRPLQVAVTLAMVLMLTLLLLALVLTGPIAQRRRARRSASARRRSTSGTSPSGR